jgi:pimeloyl-ACP methyl ester carboxylesterase
MFFTGARGRIHYRYEPHPESSEAPICFIHGLGANLSYWLCGISSDLRRCRSLLYYDLRGHGLSEISASGYSLDELVLDLFELLDSLNIQTVSLVGHSHGGLIATLAAILRPSRVSSVVIADSFFFSITGHLKLADWPYWQFLRSRILANAPIALPPDDSVIDFHLLRLVHSYAFPSRSRSHPGLASPILDFVESGDPAYADALSQLKDQTLLTLSALSSVKCPVFAVYGQHSHCIPVFDRLPEVFSDYKSYMMPNSGHFFPQRFPRDFASQLHLFYTS